MKTSTLKLIGTACTLAALGAAPLARAQTAEEFAQLKAMVTSMQQTIEAQNARIAELEKARSTAGAVMPGLTAETSPSIRTLEKVAAGESIGQQSPVTYRPAMNDQQDAASRPGDFTLDPKFRGFIPIPNTPVLMKFNAKPHVDFVADNKNAGNQNRFVPAVFPLEGDPTHGGGSQVHMNANATQLKVDVRAPELPGNLRFFYQNDFFGSGSDVGEMKYRIQHIYGQIYGFKAGFTYGIWEDPDSWPDTVDYEGPNSVIFSRRPVAQYTTSWNDNWNTTFGVEEPDLYVDTNSGPNPGGYFISQMPDLGLNTRYEKAGFGHLQFSALFRDIGARDSVGKEHRDFGWGLNMSAGIDLSEKNTFQFLGVYGEGVGGQGNDAGFLNTDAAFNSKGDLEALPYWSVMFGLTHRWSDAYRSTFTYGYAQVDNTDGQAGDFYHCTQYGSANLIWQARPRLSVGFELLWGTKTVKDDRTSGDVFRFQTGLVYSLFD